MTHPGTRLVYVAGPYRAATPAGVELNIQTALNVGLRAAKLGWSPVIPHANTAHLDAAAPGLGDDFWLRATMALMLRCDAVVLCPGWRSSVGTLDEIGQAQAVGIPVYDAIDALPALEAADPAAGPAGLLDELMALAAEKRAPGGRACGC